MADVESSAASPALRTVPIIKPVYLLVPLGTAIIQAALELVASAIGGTRTDVPVLLAIIVLVFLFLAVPPFIVALIVWFAKGKDGNASCRAFRIVCIFLCAWVMLGAVWNVLRTVLYG